MKKHPIISFLISTFKSPILCERQLEISFCYNISVYFAFTNSTDFYQYFKGFANNEVLLRKTAFLSSFLEAILLRTVCYQAFTFIILTIPIGF